MSKSPLYRAGVDTARKQYEAGVDTARKQYEVGAAFTRKQYRAGAAFARSHTRISTVAATAAAAGVLGAAAFAGGTAPWTQAIGNATSSVQNTPQASSGQSDTSLFAIVTGTAKAAPATATGTAKATPGTQLDALRSTPGATASAAVTGNNQHAKPATVVSKQSTQQPAVTVQSAKAGTAKAATAKVVKAVKAEAPKPVAKPQPKPYLVYDSVTPSSIPAGQPAAVYADGSYAASSTQVAGHHSVLWIDTNGSDPKANVLDVEPGDATPAGAAQWVQQRLTEQPKSTAIVYTMLSDWSQVKANVDQLPNWMQSKVQYWIADPTGVPHVVPGSSATQWYWGTNYDITTANPNF
jgi:hypothetical protein